jgi:hypothetical protein
VRMPVRYCQTVSLVQCLCVTRVSDRVEAVVRTSFAKDASVQRVSGIDAVVKVRTSVAVLALDDLVLYTSIVPE